MKKHARFSFQVLVFGSYFVFAVFTKVTPFVSSMELFSRKPVLVPLSVGQQSVFYVDPFKHSPNAAHVVFQVHSQQCSLNASFVATTKSVAGQFTVGTNIGLVSLLRRGDPVQYLVTVVGCSNVEFVNILLAVIVYDIYDPIPGACNLDLPLENDPNLYLTTKDDQTKVEFAYGNVDDQRWQCGEERQRQRMEYVIYQLFLDERHRDEDNFMSYLLKTIDSESIQQNCHQITSLTGSKKLDTLFAAYTGQGVIYAVVLRTKDALGNVLRSAAYVPVVTYSCDVTQGKDCKDPNELAVSIMLIIYGVAGLLLCFFGHRWILFEMFSFGFLALQLASFILITRFITASSADSLYISLGCGAVGGILWLLLWVFVGSPILSVLLVGLEFGFLFASVLYIMTPLVLFEWLLIDSTYNLVFYSTVLTAAVILLIATRFLNILCCSVIGSYLALLAIDWFLQGGIHWVIINAVRKASIPGFTSAYSTMPFQLTDLALSVLWVLLALTGVAFQLYRERERPPFPACPWSQFQFRRTTAESSNRDERPVAERQRSDISVDDFRETDPLLGSNRHLSRHRQQRGDSRGHLVWQPGEQIWQPDAATQQPSVASAPPPYSTESYRA